MDGEATSRIEDFLKIRLDQNLVKEELNRAQAAGRLPDRIAQLFENLKELESLVPVPTL